MSFTDRSPSRIETDSPVSVSKQLLSILTRDIAENRYSPGQRFPSERALAEKFGISRPSVREAVAQMIVQGVLVRTNGRGTFVAERNERTVLRPDLARQLGFWISERVFHFAQAGYNQILSGFTEICRMSGCRLQFHPVPEGTAVELPNSAGPGRLDGSIVVGGVNRDLVDRLNQLGTPLILVDLLNSTNGVSVSIDYARGTKLAIDYLYELGHREIGFIGFPNSAKYVAYWRCLQANHLEYCPQHVEFFDWSDLLPGMLSGYRAMQTLIARSSRPTAVLITNDYAALGAMEALAIAGVSVPDEMSIIGYDDLGQTTIPLTTVRSDLIEVGRIAGRTLLKWIEDDSRPEKETAVPVELIVRASTAPPSCEGHLELSYNSSAMRGSSG
jgi:DNA-binding LacI/PurR family transcriptional regulator